MTYPGRAGVCAGDTYRSQGPDARQISLNGRKPDLVEEALSPPEWNTGCRNVQVHAVVELRDGHTVAVRWYAGGAWGPATATTTDLGQIDAAAATQVLLTTAGDTVLREWRQTLSAVAVADGANMTEILADLAKRRTQGLRVRQWAMTKLFDENRQHWYDMVFRIALDSSEPAGLRETAAALFSGTTPGWERAALIKIAREADSPPVRRAAIRRLAGVRDPAVAKVLEDIAEDARQ